MIFLKRKNKSITREYSKNAIRIRRMLVNLYRPFDRYSENLFLSKIDIMAYIMVSLFSISAILFAAGINYEYLPFLSGFFINVILFSYFYARPLTWTEMYDYEKRYYREIFYLPSNWEPKKQDNDENN